jgi:ATP-dependent Lon protease
MIFSKNIILFSNMSNPITDDAEPKIMVPHEINSHGQAQEQAQEQAQAQPAGTAGTAGAAEIYAFLKTKILYFQRIIQRTIISAHRYKQYDILNQNDIEHCTTKLQELFLQLTKLYYPIINNININVETIVGKLQDINNDISSIIKQYGTYSLTDLVTICFGNKFKLDLSSGLREKNELLDKFTHPIKYKVITQDKKKTKSHKKDKDNMCKNKITEDIMIAEYANDLDCFDLNKSDTNFFIKVYGFKLLIRNAALNKCIIVYCISDDISLDCLQYGYIDKKIMELRSTNTLNSTNLNDFDEYVNLLSIKDVLIYSGYELHENFLSCIKCMEHYKQKILAQIIKDFINSDLYKRREVLIHLLIKDNDSEFQYLAYLLYDMLSTDNGGTIDTQEQTTLYDSLPRSIKKKFKNAMHKTIECTNKLSMLETTNKVPLEQQICLLKVPEYVKEKAMIKLKEVKAKSDESGTKARQYLDGLLKIPFGIYRREALLDIVGDTKVIYSSVVRLLRTSQVGCSDETILGLENSNITIAEISKNINIIAHDVLPTIYKAHIAKLITEINHVKRDKLINNTNFINKLIAKNRLSVKKLLHSGKKVEFLKIQISNLFAGEIFEYGGLTDAANLFLNQLFIRFVPEYIATKISLHLKISDNIGIIREKRETLRNNITNISTALDGAIHGHTNAKRQIERIIGQWINGDDQSGYCFGFEGPPGVGKTSLAKVGLSNCLIDENGTPRPFALIAIGGSAVTLDGHNYTYVGSNHGRILDILMDVQCLNPIIFIDELDKISNTEHGRDIVGVLTHLCDSTQNNEFQDKYFSGINIDLSKALFIFSYNDANKIDRILLDRIHRIKFSHLSLSDKIVIAEKYLLPDIYSKMGLDNNIVISGEVVRYLIETHTSECGVRKLKELLFEIIGEINLELLQNDVPDLNIPVLVTIAEVQTKYLKEHNKCLTTKIHKKNSVGIINGLWANMYGMGGIITIETTHFPSKSFLDLKLTGNQGDVMKESMNVALTVALNALSEDERETIMTGLEDSKYHGIHIHCPEGGVPKDGPSAGTAITVAIYSLLTKRTIKRDIALTGEINLRGNVTAIGGLDLKIIGGISAGVKNSCIRGKINRILINSWRNMQAMI